MSQRRILRIAIHILTMAAILSGWANRADAIRYELIDGAGGFQGNHTLSGFIEFDLPCGRVCSGGNVVDFEFSVTGDTSYSYSYQSSADVFLGQPNASRRFVNATPLLLSVDYGAVGILALGKSPDGPSLQWASTFDPTYISFGPGATGGWQSGGEKPPVETVIGNVIPEPATAIGVFLGALVVCVFRRRRDVTQPRHVPYGVSIFIWI